MIPVPIEVLRPEVGATIARLYAAKVSLDVIAARLSLWVPTVRRVLYRMGLKAPEGKGWRRARTKLCPKGHVHLGWHNDKRRLADGTVKTYKVRRCVVCDKKRRPPGRGPNWKRELTHCPKGHPYSGENLGVQVIREDGKEREARLCLTCRRLAQKAFKARERAKAAGREVRA